MEDADIKLRSFVDSYRKFVLTVAGQADIFDDVLYICLFTASVRMLIDFGFSQVLIGRRNMDFDQVNRRKAFGR